jgi:hypothetical protein
LLLEEFKKIDEALKFIEDKDIRKINEIIKEIKNIKPNEGSSNLKGNLENYQKLKYPPSTTGGGRFNSNHSSVKSKRLPPPIKNRKTKRIMKNKPKHDYPRTLRQLKERKEKSEKKRHTLRRRRM